MDLKTIKSIIEKEEITTIDVRFMVGDSECGVSYPTKNFDYALLLSKPYIVNDFEIDAINMSRYFIDPFLAHRTIVFLGGAVGDSPSNEICELSFSMDDLDGRDAALLEGVECLTPPLDQGRDIRGEIVMAMQQINVEVLSHYCKKDVKTHVVAIKSSKYYLDDVRKFKYCCLMVAKAYNIKISV